MEEEKVVGVDMATEPDRTVVTGWQKSPNRKNLLFAVGVYKCVRCGKQGTFRNAGPVKLCEKCINTSGKTTTAQANRIPRKDRREMDRAKAKLLAKGIVTPKE